MSKYLRLITHGKIKIDCKNPPITYEGICSQTPHSSTVLIVTKDENRLLCIYTTLDINVEYLASNFHEFKANSEIKFIIHSNAPHKEVNDRIDFLLELKASLMKCGLSSFQFQRLFISSPMVIINFNGELTPFHEHGSLLVQSPPFSSARIAINQLNYLASFKPNKKDAEYLDLQFFKNVITAMPKLTQEGYMLWTVLNKKDPKLLVKNAFISHSAQRLVLNPSYTASVYEYLGWYNDYVEIIKSNANKQMGLCVDKFRTKAFQEASEAAKRALQCLLQLNEEQVENELSLSYYNLGSAFIMRKQFSEALSFLEKAKVFCIKIGNQERLAKVDAKLRVCNASPQNLLELPKEILLNILGYLTVSDISHFACTSSYSRQVASDGLLWQRKLFNEFTTLALPETKSSYQQQYKIKYVGYQRGSSKDGFLKRAVRVNKDVTKDELLINAIRIGAEVLAKKLIREGATFKRTVQNIRLLLKSKNVALIELLIENGLNVNEPIPEDVGQTSIFHIAAMKAPEMLSIFKEMGILPSLHAAVINNNLKTLEEALKRTRVDEEDLNKRTSLWWALLLNNFSMAQYLLSKGASIETLSRGSYFGFDIIAHLISMGYRQCLELLLQKGLFVNHILYHKDTYKTLLYIAAEYGQLEMIYLLIKNGASINPPFQDKEVFELQDGLLKFDDDLYLALSPISAAAKNKQLKVLEAISELGISIHVPGIRGTKDKRNKRVIYRTPPLIEAVSALSEEVVQFLLKNGASAKSENVRTYYAADGKILDTSKESAFRALLNTLSDFSKFDYQKESSKAKAWFNILKLLLKYSDPPTSFNFLVLDLIKRPLSFKEIKYNQEGHLCSISSVYLNSNLREAFILEAFTILMKYNANFMMTDELGKTALHYAAENGFYLLVRQLVEKKGVDINLKDNEKETAIFGAARNLHETIYNYLKDKGITVEDNNKGETPNQIVSSSILKRFKG